MQTRHLANGLTVSAIGYGAMGLSEFYGETNDEKAMQLLEHLIDYGISFIDTADFYGQGHNESLLGTFLAKLDSATRTKFKIATKCGIQRLSQSAASRAINNQPDYIIRCCEDSLKRLGIECIDLFYLHRIDAHTPIEESMACLSQLVQQGKIRHIGLCEVSAATIRKAHQIHPITAIQTEYSLWTREIEHEVLPTIKELGIGLIPYSPLGRGFLTGKYINHQDFADNDFRKNNERFQQTNLDHNLKLLDILQPIADKHQCTTGQIALAWLLAQYDQLVPIPGTKQLTYLKENAASADIQLDSEDLIQLNASKHQLEIKGKRYSQDGMKGINA